MIFDRKTIELLEGFRQASWEGVVFRHMFGEIPPDRENITGARWNPAQIPAIYASLGQEVAVAEADYYISLQPLRPRAKRKIYRINVQLDSVLDLSNWETLANFGLNKESFNTIEHSACQLIGGAVEWLGHDGLLVPSARANGINLVIFPNRQKVNYRFEVFNYIELEGQ